MFSLSDYIKFVKRSAKVQLTEKTLKNYRVVMTTLELTYGLNVNEPSIENLVEVLDRIHSADISSYSVNTYLRPLIVFTRYSKIEIPELLQDSFAYKKGPPKRKLHPSDLLSPLEVQDIITHTQSAALRAYFACLWDSGRRPSGLIRLDMRDIASDKHGYVLTFKKTKTSTARTPVRLLTPIAISYLQQWLSIHPDRKNLDAPVFITRRGTRYKVNNVLVGLKLTHEERLERGKHGSKCRIHLYLFRKSRITWLLKEGSLSEHEIKVRIGHERHSTTLQKYYAILDESDQAEAELKYLGITPKEEDAPQLMICPNCGVVNEEGESTCLRCRLPLNEEELQRQTQLTVDQALVNLSEASPEFQELVSKALAKALPEALKQFQLQATDKVEKN